MAENTINDFNTLPEQVQLNKEDIETNTADIAKLKDDISKIKPNAWEERKFNFDLGEDDNVVFTTYNPNTDANAPVNAQKAFINKDTYSITDAINSYSFFISGSLSGQSMSIYAVCTHPSNSLLDILDLDEQNKPAPSIVLITSKDETGKTSSSLDINCTKIKTDNIQSKSMTMADNNGDFKEINSISDNDDTSLHTLLTAFATNEYYLKKSDASNTYLTKTDASNTYLTKQDYDNRFDTGVISLTAQGLNKIKGLTDTPNQDLELHVPSDFLELSQQPTGKDLKLQIIYNSSPLYDNIVLHSNKTIGDYDNISSSSPKAVWYTGQAIITLTSQSDGLFDIAYHDGNLLGLHLITTF